MGLNNFFGGVGRLPKPQRDRQEQEEEDTGRVTVVVTTPDPEVDFSDKFIVVHADIDEVQQSLDEKGMKYTIETHDDGPAHIVVVTKDNGIIEFYPRKTKKIIY